MALTAPNLHLLHPASPAKTFDDSKGAALARLVRLHDEASHTFRQSQLLDRAPSACLALMLSGGLMLFFMARQGGAGLEAAFVWSLWLLTGIIAMTVIYLRGFARHPALAPLDGAVRELRKFLLYTGMAWGLGAYAVMPDRPDMGLILTFAALPALAVIGSFRDNKSALAFSLPVLLLSAGAAQLRNWPHGLVTVLAVAGLFMLRCAISWKGDPR